MNNNSDGSCDENNSNKVWNEGSGPKVKNCICKKENISQQQQPVSNGTTCEDGKVSPVQNNASCSFSISLSSLSCTNQKSHLNGECSGEKSYAKSRVLHTEENSPRNHDKKRKGAGFLDSESSSGNEGEEGLSSDDCCIYTYKGDQFADLPNSFFSDDMVVNGHQPLRENHRKANHRREPEDNDRDNLGSSPEMDYLEMDFDPGPSLEQDSEEDLNAFERRLNNDSPVPELPNEFYVENEEKEESCQEAEPQAGPSNDNSFEPSVKCNSRVSDCNSNSFRTKDFLGRCCAGFCSVKENNQSCGTTVEEKQLENGVGNNLVTDSIVERLDKKILTENNDIGASVNSKKEGESKVSFDEIMLWTEQQAISKQVILISSEVSCAATAVINAMFVLKMRISIEKVKEGISTRLKSESPSIPQYLVSRSFAGVAHENLIQGIHHASHGLLYARFFQMYPRRDIVLARWLCYWMKKGAVPIATMNVQREPTPEDPSLDTRHHQMIFGVGRKGIFLTNPLECLQEEELWTRLVTPSVLKIKRSEIVSRWSPETNLKPLMFQSDGRWKEMNVLGQVVNVIREAFYPSSKAKFLTQHISIPASSGITLVIPRYSPSYEELVSATDLPLLSESKSE